MLHAHRDRPFGHRESAPIQIEPETTRRRHRLEKRVCARLIPQFIPRTGRAIDQNTRQSLLN